MAKILVVEDNADLLDNICESLSAHQHNVDQCSDGLSALTYLKTYEYDVIVLDWTLPKVSGIEILKQYRGQGGATPVIMLTGRRDLDDKEVGFDAGADDYLTKPFELRELNMRVGSLLRRGVKAPTDKMQIADVVLDKQAKRVTKGDTDLKLMPKDFAILELLMSYPDKVFSAEAIIDRIWSTSSDASPDVVRKHINRIRTKIDSDSGESLIRTVHGMGYSLVSTPGKEV
ncbi:MAG: response regulator transcription factor [Candidatus Melainabacteria bacterium]|nr:response regulator transcription factor [Candidatus Melainabacteria bacterium]